MKNKFKNIVIHYVVFLSRFIKLWYDVEVTHSLLNEFQTDIVCGKKENL